MSRCIKVAGSDLATSRIYFIYFYCPIDGKRLTSMVLASFPVGLNLKSYFVTVFRSYSVSSSSPPIFSQYPKDFVKVRNIFFI